MRGNLLEDAWKDLDSAELRLLLDERIGGPGQYHDHSEKPNQLYLPVAGPTCRIVLTFGDKEIVSVEAGPAFDPAEWERIRVEIESMLGGPLKVGRDYSFSSFRVLGSWRGDRSGVQILPPPDSAPRAPVEMADHPFILEFQMKACEFWPVTNYRRRRDHRNMTLLLNVLLAGRTSLQPRRSEHLWASVPPEKEHQGKWATAKKFILTRLSFWRSRPSVEIKWVQQFFFADLGAPVIDKLSSSAGQQLEEMDPGEYYGEVGHDGQGLRIPADLDESICLYQRLSPAHRAKFDRASFWLDMAARQWNVSVSGSFTALVSAIESLTERGDIHRVHCSICGKSAQHEVPGATRRFKDFLDTYASEATLAKRRDEMYRVRSGILHGSTLLQLDQDLAFGWDPPWWTERKLIEELWDLTRVALRNWLKKPALTDEVIR